MAKMKLRYWLCQLLGWGVWGIIIIYFNLVVFADRFEEQGGKKEFLISLLAFLVFGILSTHVLRTIITKTNWLKYSFNNIFILFIAGVGASGMLLFLGEKAWDNYSPYSQERFIREQRLDKAKKIEKSEGLNKIP